MIRTKTFTVTAGAAAEVLVDFLTSQEGKEHKLLRMGIQSTDLVVFTLFVDQDRIVEVGGGVDAYERNMILIDRPLPVGEVVKAGFLNTTGGSLSLQITVEYFEKDV